MKKIVSILTVVVLLVACLSVSVFAAGEPVLTVDEVKGEVGKNVTVNVSVSDITFASYALEVVYDHEGLELKEIKAGERSNGLSFVAKPETAKVLAFGVADTTGAGVLFSLTFEVKAEGTHEVKVVVDSFVKADQAVVDVVVEDGHVEVAHVHNWVKGEVVAPWCDTKGYTVYTCSCGETEKRDWVDALDHDWVFVELLENGELYRCSRCGEEYIEAVTGDMIGVVVALLAVSGLGITVLKKKEN